MRIFECIDEDESNSISRGEWEAYCLSLLPDADDDSFAPAAHGAPTQAAADHLEVSIGDGNGGGESFEV